VSLYKLSKGRRERKRKREILGTTIFKVFEVLILHILRLKVRGSGVKLYLLLIIINLCVFY